MIQDHSCVKYSSAAVWIVISKFKSNMQSGILFRQRPDVANYLTLEPQWKQLHSPWMFLQCLICYMGPPSHLLHKIMLPLSLVMLSLAFNAVWYALKFALYPDMIELDRLSSTSRAYQLSSFAIALLLTFRLNRGFDRWKVATESFARFMGSNLQIVQLLSIWAEDKNIIKEARKWAIVSMYSLIMAALQLKHLPEQAVKLLSPDELALFKACPSSVTSICATRMRMLLKKANLPIYCSLATDNLVTAGYGGVGGAYITSYFAMPISIRLTSSGLLLIWLIILPFGELSFTLDNNVNRTEIYIGGSLLIICVFLLSLLLLCIDQIATDLEFPFKYIPVFEMARDDIEQMNDMLRSKEVFDAIDGMAESTKESQ